MCCTGCTLLFSLPMAHSRGFQVALAVKPPASAGDTGDSGSFPGLGRSPEGGHGNILQYSCLENPMDRAAWRATVHRVPKSRTQLSDFTFPFHCHALEKEMATHSSVLAWRILGTGSLVDCRLWGREESDTTERLHFHFSLSCIGEGNGNPLQCPCLENPRDGEPGGLLSMGSHRVGHD